MNSWSSPLGGSVKTATRVAMPLCTRSAASSAPAPAESSDTTMKSEGAIGSLTTSAHPAARKAVSRMDGTARMAAAANAATSTRIRAHLRRRGNFMLGSVAKITGRGRARLGLMLFSTTNSQSLVAKGKDLGGHVLGRQLFQPHCKLSEICVGSAGSSLKQARRPGRPCDDS